MGTGDGMLVARIKGAVAVGEVCKTRERIKRKHLELAVPASRVAAGSCFGYEAAHRRREIRGEGDSLGGQVLLDGGTIYGSASIGWKHASSP